MTLQTELARSAPATDARLAEAFSRTLLLTAREAAALIGLDVKTLARMTDTGAIRAVRRGKLRAYTEADIRAFLTEDASPCPSTSPLKAPTSSSISLSGAAGFTDRPARLHDAPPRRPRDGSGSKRRKAG
jgi:excisionase family DNA binding protein